MGGHVDKLARLSYAEVPTADAEEDGVGARVGVSYIFSADDDGGAPEEDDGTDDRRRRRRTPHPPEYELECAVYHAAACVYERRAGDLPVDRSAESLARECVPGDLVEFVAAGRSPHWAVYIGDSQVVHLHRAEVRRALVADAARGRHGRIASRLYKYKPLNAAAVVRNATERVGERELTWKNSECFAAWCKFGRREFKTGGELRIGKQPYKLKLLQDSSSRELEFQTLEDAIMERRRMDRVDQPSAPELDGHR